MELRAADVAALNDRREALTVVACRNAVLVGRRCITMDEVRLRARPDAVEQRRRARRFEGVPAHVRHANAGAWLEFAHTSAKQAEARDVALLGGIEQQLHP